MDESFDRFIDDMGFFLYMQKKEQEDKVNVDKNTPAAQPKTYTYRISKKNLWTP